MKYTAALKVGFLTILSIIILVFSIMWLKGRSISAGNRIQVAFYDVDGMRPGSAVQMMGHRVGQVEEIIPFITPEKSYVKVKFIITEPQINVPKASEITIQQSGIIGEKFLEITPPPIKEVFLPLEKDTVLDLKAKDLVLVNIEGKTSKAGVIKDISIVNTNRLPVMTAQKLGTKKAYKIRFLINKPGIIVKDDNPFEIQNSKLIFSIDKEDSLFISDLNKDYTILEPIRMKDFIELQISAARSLNETNKKINEILTDDIVDDVKLTLQSIKDVSVTSKSIADNVDELVKSSKDDIEAIVNMTTTLTEKLSRLTDNLNQIVEDKDFKKNLAQTTKNVNRTAVNLNKLLESKDTKDTLIYVKEATKNVAEISSFVNEMTKDEDLKQKLNCTTKNLNASLYELSETLGNVNEITVEEEASIKEILRDTKETSENMKEFSKRLNKRFLLFRLMF